MSLFFILPLFAFAQYIENPRILLLSDMKSGRVVVRSADVREPPAILNNPFIGEGASAWTLLRGLREAWTCFSCFFCTFFLSRRDGWISKKGTLFPFERRPFFGSFCSAGLVKVKLAEEVYQLLKAFPSPDFDPPLDSLMKDGFGGQYCAQHLGLWQHPFGSARIGPVLDHQLRVRGVEDLYVADASALPDWALAGHPDAGIRAVGSLVAQFAAADVEKEKF